jgi:hypothetical protein
LDLKRADDDFIQKVTHQIDDNEEFNLLTKYLGLAEQVMTTEKKINSDESEKELMHGSFL